MLRRDPSRSSESLGGSAAASLIDARSAPDPTTTTSRPRSAALRTSTTVVVERPRVRRSDVGRLRPERPPAPLARPESPRRSSGNDRQASWQAASHDVVDSGGSSRRRSLSGGGTSLTCAQSTETGVSLTNGGSPARHSKSTQPSEYTSARLSTSPPSTSSGATYSAGTRGHDRSRSARPPPPRAC